MKKISIFLLIVCFFVANFSIYTVASSVESTFDTTETTTVSATEPVFVDENSAIANGSFSADALNPLLGNAEVVKNASSAIAFEMNSQTLMYALNPDEQMYPASMVKILTGLLAIKKGNLEDIVTVSQGAIESVPHDAVSADLLVGEKLTLQDLLYCLLLGSANDAAAVIAEHVSGSESAFVEDMNQFAEELGCLASHFTNPHGLHNDNQYTTARDVLKILVAALSDPTFRTIFTADSYNLPATNLSLERKLVSGNSMKDPKSKLYYDPRVIGGRTGVTEDGKRCLAAAAESNGMLVASVVMGAESVYQEDGYSAIRIGGYRETTQLFDACLNGYQTAQILRTEQVLRQIPVEGAENDLLVGPQVSVSTVLPLEISMTDLSFRYADRALSLPISKGDPVSKVQIWYGGMCVAQAQLFAMNDVYRSARVTAVDTDNRGFTASAVLIVVVLVIFVFATVFIVIRFSDKIKHVFVKTRRKRYRNSRKRVK